MLNAVGRAAEILERTPYINAVSQEISKEGLDYRKCLVLGYIIVYKVTRDEVIFLRMFHQSQDYERHVIEWD